MIQICTPAGLINIQCGQGGIEFLCFTEIPLVSKNFTPAEKRCAEQLDEYFTLKRKVFSLPLALKGSSFESAVWQELLKIPYGRTESYGAIAAAIGKSGAARAVGMACHRNPVAIIVPCHRVVSSTGEMTGYRAGIERKKFLLQLETPTKTFF